MPGAIEIDVLAADRGDCLWIECAREGGRPWRLLFDGGMPETWPLLRQRVEALDPADRLFDLAVVSHVDSDHIGGMLALLGAPELGVRFGDVWFNGLPQLPQDPAGPSRSVAEGESLMRLLSGGTAAPLPWNRAFGGSAVMTAGDGGVLELRRADEPAITLLSPTPKRLTALRRKWVVELARLQRGEPAEPPAPPSPPAPLDDLPALAATETGRDSSAANGSSIAFLLEHRGASVLLAADAFASVLGAALRALANARRQPAVEVDVFKLSHHASKGNVTEKLLALAPARHYVVSTNGARFHHPDDIALARVATTAQPGARIWFNYATPQTLRWGERQLCARHEYDALYPPDDSCGVRLSLSGRE